MEARTRLNTALRYRFATLEQARAHVREVEGRKVFFYRDDKLRLLPYAPVMLEWSFDNDEPARMVHGWVLGVVEGSGTWIELLGTRSLRELAPTEYTRHWPRLGCDLLVEVRSADRAETGRLLDLSNGGGRIAGITGLERKQPVEIRLLSPDRLTFYDLSNAYVAWTDRDEIGVQFDMLDSISRIAVSRVLRETEEMWARAWEALHPAFCCAQGGVVDPEPPRLRPAEERQMAR
jgi:hypothetical protein